MAIMGHRCLNNTTFTVLLGFPANPASLSLAAGIAHEVIVAEQLGTGPFNRGALLNFAFLAAEAGTGTLAIVDVDMLPLPGVNFSDVGCGCCLSPSRHGDLTLAYLRPILLLYRCLLQVPS